MTRVGRQAYVSHTISREHDDDDDVGDGRECAFIGFRVDIGTIQSAFTITVNTV